LGKILGQFLRLRFETERSKSYEPRFIAFRDRQEKESLDLVKVTSETGICQGRLRTVRFLVEWLPDVHVRSQVIHPTGSGKIEVGQ